MSQKKSKKSFCVQKNEPCGRYSGVIGKPGRSGRPKGSGAGLEVQLTVRFAPETLRAVEEEAAEQGMTPGGMIREIVDRWTKRRAHKGTKR